MIRVLIVHQRPPVNQVLAGVIRSAPDMRVVGQMPRLSDKVARQPVACDLVLLDVEQPDKQLLPIVRRMAEWDDCKVVVVGVELTEFILQCLQAGAIDCVLRNESQSMLVCKLRAVHEGKVLLSPALTYQLVSRLAELTQFVSKVDLGQDPFHLLSKELTPREQEVLEYIERGYTNRMIAEILTIATGTVKNHVHRILRKLKVDNRQEAGALARAVRRKTGEATAACDFNRVGSSRA